MNNFENSYQKLTTRKLKLHFTALSLRNSSKRQSTSQPSGSKDNKTTTSTKTNRSTLANQGASKMSTFQSGTPPNSNSAILASLTKVKVNPAISTAPIGISYDCVNTLSTCNKRSRSFSSFVGLCVGVRFLQHPFVHSSVLLGGLVNIQGFC